MPFVYIDMMLFILILELEEWLKALVSEVVLQLVVVSLDTHTIH